jgi:hypothetical protein
MRIIFLCALFYEVLIEMSGSNNNEENTRERHTVTVIKNKNGRFIVEGIDSSSKPVAANTVTGRAKTTPSIAPVKKAAQATSNQTNENFIEEQKTKASSLSTRGEELNTLLKAEKSKFDEEKRSQMSSQTKIRVGEKVNTNAIIKNQKQTEAEWKERKDKIMRNFLARKRNEDSSNLATKGLMREEAEAQSAVKKAKDLRKTANDAAEAVEKAKQMSRDALSKAAKARVELGKDKNNSVKQTTLDDAEKRVIETSNALDNANKVLIAARSAAAEAEAALKKTKKEGITPKGATIAKMEKTPVAAPEAAATGATGATGVNQAASGAAAAASGATGVNQAATGVNQAASGAAAPAPVAAEQVAAPVVAEQVAAPAAAEQVAAPAAVAAEQVAAAKGGRRRTHRRAHRSHKRSHKRVHRSRKQRTQRKHKRTRRTHRTRR